MKKNQEIRNWVWSRFLWLAHVAQQGEGGPVTWLVFNFSVPSMPCDLKLWLLLSIRWINETQTG